MITKASASEDCWVFSKTFGVVFRVVLDRCYFTRLVAFG
ncbi:hypothetical protein [uncultured Gammaproteobacteria bacterium]|nr:hypothetical protein [uncultured Gammaproteobacteria bacterium]